MTELYRVSEPFHSFTLPVSEGHQLYVEQVGTPGGIPVVFLHGGPGGGIEPSYRQFFNPEQFHVILFDQRGCGKSLPFSSLEANTTSHLLADIEAIREKLGIEKWIVFGGSWGSTLALTYALKYSQRVAHLVLRGIFLGTKAEIDWFYEGGTSAFYPDAWEAFLEPVAPQDRSSLVEAYFKLLTSKNQETRRKAARAWSQWEATTCRLVPDREQIAKFDGTPAADAFSRIECHYFINRCFFETDSYILDHVDQLKDVSGYIVQGRYDLICCPNLAWNLHRAWQRSRLDFAQSSGHSLFEKEISTLLLKEMDRIASVYPRI